MQTTIFFGNGIIPFDWSKNAYQKAYEMIYDNIQENITNR